MLTITIYTDIPLTEQDLKYIRKKLKVNCVYIPHDHTVIEYIDRKEIEPKNIQELLTLI